MNKLEEAQGHAEGLLRHVANVRTRPEVVTALEPQMQFLQKYRGILLRKVGQEKRGTLQFNSYFHASTGSTRWSCSVLASLVFRRPCHLSFRTIVVFPAFTGLIDFIRGNHYSCSLLVGPHYLLLHCLVDFACGNAYYYVPCLSVHLRAVSPCSVPPIARSDNRGIVDEAGTHTASIHCTRRS